MRPSKIKLYNTHYEINDYDVGDFKQLEYDLTFHDWISHTHTPRFKYDENERILYVPRGVDRYILEQWSGEPINVIRKHHRQKKFTFELKSKPRDDIQYTAIRYLTSNGEFKSTNRDTQKILIMPPGTGKTFCTIAAMAILGYRTAIIVHNNNLKTQWIEKIKEYTNLGGPNIIEVDSTHELRRYMTDPPTDNNVVFVFTHRLLMFYEDKYGDLGKLFNIMGIGMKVFDEVHKEYKATLSIDYATNVPYTIYLTATFALSQYAENRIFQFSYKMVRKLRLKPEDMRHIIYISVLFNTRPLPMDVHKVEGKQRGFDRFEYIDYEIENGTLERELREMLNTFKGERNMEGKILLLSSKKATCDYFNNVIQSEIPGINSCSFYTDNKVAEYKQYDAISATPAMLGTGEDIPGLRFLFNTEPGRSLTNTDQFSGRLRPYKDGKPTYYIEFIDVGFPKLVDMYRTRLKLLKTKVRECHEIVKTLNKY